MAFLCTQGYHQVEEEGCIYQCFDQKVAILAEIKGDEIKAHFNNKNVGNTDSWAGTFNTIPFHVYAMKESNCIMSLMSTYGTNDHDNSKDTRWDWKEGSMRKSTTFRYPEVIHNQCVGNHQVPFPMCTLETLQKYCSTSSLLLTFC